MTGNVSIKGAAVLDVITGDYEETDLRVVDGRIVELGRRAAAKDGSAVINGHGKFVIPGLIDAHVHVNAATADLAALNHWAPSYVAHQAARLMGQMLDRGFTTVRDVAGGDFGLHAAQAEGLVRGPRLFFGGKALSQTGGHGDPRPAGGQVHDDHPCCAGMSRIADGEAEVRRAARDELRKGAHHLKVMASGGVASPTDRVDSVQYSAGELRAVVEEAEAANRYVTAHAYTARAVNHALGAGIRCIEHGNLIDETSVALFREHDAFLVPTLVTYWALNREGTEHGLSPESWAKVADVLDAGIKGLELAVRGAVPLAYGTDLLGGMQRHQAREFSIRAEVQPAIDVIRSATVVGAELLQRPDELGIVAPGAHADLLILARDPLQDLSVLAESRIETVIQAGHVVSDRSVAQ